MGDPLLPVYELSLSSNEPLTAPTRIIPLPHEASVRVRCFVQDSGFDGSSLYLTRNQRNITQDRRGHSVLFTIPSFDSNKGEEIFDCTARRRGDSKYHVRSLKFTRSRKPRLSNGATECEANNCRNEGLCLKTTEGKAYCLCATGYMGEHCEQTLATTCGSDGIDVPDLSLGIASVAFFALLAVVLAFLFFREKKKASQLKRTIKQLRVNQNLDANADEGVDLEGGDGGNEDLENLYDQADGQHVTIRRPTITQDYDNLKFERPKAEESKAERTPPPAGT